MQHFLQRVGWPLLGVLALEKSTCHLGIAVPPRGLNDSGQCGVGWPRPKALEQQVVAQATCLQPWAAHYSVSWHII